MIKWMGWPEASEHGGHMVKRLSDPAVKAEDRFECQDCHIVGDAAVFGVGIRGCPKRPESLDYLDISVFEGFESMSTQDRAVVSRNHWKGFADRVGMKLQYWTPVDNDPEVCARFEFWPHSGGHEEHESFGKYELRFGQKERYPNEIHAVRV